MSDTATFWRGLLVFFFCIMLSLLLFWSGGLVIDNLHEKAGDLPGSDSNFAKTAGGQVYFFINCFYGLCYIIPILGLAIFLQSIVKKVGTSQYDYRRL